MVAFVDGKKVEMASIGLRDVVISKDYLLDKETLEELVKFFSYVSGNDAFLILDEGDTWRIIQIEA